MQYLIMCRSLTVAQKSATVLERKGINAVVVKAPQGLSTGGCGYALSLNRRYDEALRILKNNKLITGKSFASTESGEYKELF